MLVKEGKPRLLTSFWSRVFCPEVMWNQSISSFLSSGKIDLGARNLVGDPERLLYCRSPGSALFSSTRWATGCVAGCMCRHSARWMHVRWACVQARPALTCLFFARVFFGTDIFSVKKEGERQMRRGRQLEIRLESVRQRNRKKKMDRPWKEINGQNETMK